MDPVHSAIVSLTDPYRTLLGSRLVRQILSPLYMNVSYCSTVTYILET